MKPEEELHLPPVRRPPVYRHVLCLSGGGYRGLYTALVLEELEKLAGKPLRDMFDVIAGTSIGGVISAGVAVGIRASVIRNAIETHGPALFDRRIGWGRWRLPVRNRLRAIYSARYSQPPLRNVIDTVLGANAESPLSIIGKPLVICAVDVDCSSPQVLLSQGLTAKDNIHLTLRDALLATTAAPTYFPPHRVDGRIFVDGGLVANAPDLVAVTETVRRLACKLDNVRVLSIGTAGGAHATPESSGSPGLLEWIVRKGLVQLTLSAQEQLAVEQCGVLLGDRFLRVDSLPTQGGHRHLGLDMAGEVSTAALRSAAEGTISALRSGEMQSRVRRFLRHDACHPSQHTV